MARNITIRISPGLQVLVPGLEATSELGTLSLPVSYSTGFPLTENPISESAAWQHLDALQANVRTTGSAAYGTQDGTGFYNDSSAYLTGFGTDYEIIATIRRAPVIPSDGANREVELLFRWTDNNTLRSTSFGTTHCIGYEMNLQHNGAYMQLGRFKEDVGLVDMVPHKSGGGGFTPQTGDTWRARIEGFRIQSWYTAAGDTETLQFDYTDVDAAKIATGNPGIGFFISNGFADAAEFGFDAITVTAL